jgi:hypothetical protein
MFLYTKVVLGNLQALSCVAELEDELNVNFPDGLDAA